MIIIQYNYVPSEWIGIQQPVYMLTIKEIMSKFTIADFEVYISGQFGLHHL